MTRLLLCLLLLVPESSADGPPTRLEGIEASFHVRIPDQGPGPRRGRAIFEVNLHGTRDFEVGEPQLEDALAAWKIVRRRSSFRTDDLRTTQTLTLELEQSKPGTLPLPGLRLRVRLDSSPWQEVTWLDPLHETCDVVPPIAVPYPPPSIWFRMLLYGCGILVSLTLLGILVWTVRRYASRRAVPHSPQQQALAQLRALNSSAMPAQQMAVVADILRTFLEQQRTIPATRMTTSELSHALKSDPVKMPLLALLDRCDQAKFAQQDYLSENIQQEVEEACRILVDLATQSGESKGAGESGTEG